MTTDPPPADPDTLTNLVAVASIDWQEALGRLADRCTDAAGMGVPISDIARAAGITCDQTATLINQGDL